MFSNSGEFLFIMLGDGTIRTYEVPSLELYHRVVAHPAPCFCVDVDPRGRWVTIIYLVFIFHAETVRVLLGISLLAVLML